MFLLHRLVEVRVGICFYPKWWKLSACKLFGEISCNFSYLNIYRRNKRSRNVSFFQYCLFIFEATVSDTLMLTYWWNFTLIINISDRVMLSVYLIQPLVNFKHKCQTLPRFSFSNVASVILNFSLYRPNDRLISCENNRENIIIVSSSHQKPSRSPSEVTKGRLGVWYISMGRPV